MMRISFKNLNPIFESKINIMILLFLSIVVALNGVKGVSFENSNGYYMTNKFVTSFTGDGCSIDSKTTTSNNKSICYWSLERSGEIQVFNYQISFVARTSTDRIQSIMVIKGSSGETYMDFRFLCHPGDGHTQLCPTVANKTYSKVNGTFLLNSTAIPNSAWNQVVDVMHYYYDNESYPLAFISYKVYLFDQNDCDLDRMKIEIENEITQGYERLSKMESENNLLTESYDHRLKSLMKLRDEMNGLHLTNQTSFRKCFQLKNELENYQQNYLPRVESLQNQVLQRNYQPIIRLKNETIDQLENKSNNKKGNNSIQLDQYSNIAELFVQNLQTQGRLLESLLDQSKDAEKQYEAQMVVDLMMNLIEILEDYKNPIAYYYDYKFY